MAIEQRTSRILLVIATCLWTVAGGASLLVAMFVPMLFDAPGSTSNLATLAFAGSVVLFPVACGAAVILSWLDFRRGRQRRALLFTLLPLLPVAAAFLSAVAHEAFSGGRLGG
jgi:hypothetical protein